MRIVNLIITKFLVKIVGSCNWKQNGNIIFYEKDFSNIDPLSLSEMM